MSRRSSRLLKKGFGAAAIALGVAIAPAQAAPEGSAPVTSTAISEQTVVQVAEPTIGGVGVQGNQGVTPSVDSTHTPATSVTANATPSITILSPKSGSVSDRPATTLTIQYPMDTTVEVRVNGKVIDKVLIGRTETDSAARKITETWYGVILEQGKNTITVHRTGETQSAASVEVSLSGAPKKLNVKTQETRIPADGRSTATVLGELLDENGNRSNWNAMITLEASDGKFVGADEQPGVPGHQVQAKQGQFTASLQSGLETKPIRIRATSGDLEAFHQLQLTTQYRPETLSTGVVNLRVGARGTNYYDRLKDFLPYDRNNDTVVDIRGAGFVTQSFGEWLFTGAFNTENGLNTDANGDSKLFGNVSFPEQQYPTFGDSSTSQRVAPSKDNAYLKFERTSPVANAGSDYFMWGDFNTEEFSTSAQQFTATNRALHGFKANYNVGNLQLTGLFASAEQAFQRDSIAPDGTSGYYFLSRRSVVDGSEKVFLELEELNRPGTVVAVRELRRGQDYDIDYDRGSILFQQPILRTAVAADGTILTQKIVVTYQFEAPEVGSTVLYGARARYHFARTPGQESWLGGTYWKEDQGTRDFELYGADAQVSIGDKAKIVAEFARSSHTAENLLGKVSGLAYRVEGEGELAKGIKARAFYRTAEAGFSNNATISFVPGQTRYGGELSAQVGNNTTIRAQIDHEDNFGIAPQVITDFTNLLNPGFQPQPGTQQDNSLTTIRAGVEQRFGNATLGLDWIHRDRDDRILGDKDVSDQLEAKFAKPILDNLTLRAAAAVNLTADEDPIYSNRVQAGLDWKVHPNVSIQLNQYYFWGSQYGNRAVTSLDTVTNYNLTKNTQLTGRFSLLGGDNEITGQGAAGIKHNWQIAPGLKMDVAYEYVMGQFFGRTAAGTQFSQPYAVGSGASALGLDSGHNFAIGLDYTDNPDLRASLRYQFRTSSGGTNSALVADLNGKLTNYLTGLARYEQAGAANQSLNLLGDSINFRVGLAYRDPKSDMFNALFRYEFRHNPETIPDTILIGSGTGSTDHTLAFEGIYAPNWQWELYGKMGYRYSQTRLADDFTSNSSMLLGQLRATYRFDYRWDITAEARTLASLSGGGTEFGASAEVGYYVTPYLRLAAGYAFGSVSDRDFDSNRSAGGPYFDVTVKLDTLFSGFSLKKKEKAPKPKSADSSQATPKSKASQAKTPPAKAPEDKAATSSPVSPPAAVRKCLFSFTKVASPRVKPILP
jgi:hypothetical protein